MKWTKARLTPRRSREGPRRGPLSVQLATVRERLRLLDLDLVRRGRSELRRVHLEHALDERRLDVLGVRVRREMEAAFEPLLQPLAEAEVLLGLRLHLLALAREDERVVGHRDSELLVVEARHVQLDDELVLRLVDFRR